MIFSAIKFANKANFAKFALTVRCVNVVYPVLFLKVLNRKTEIGKKRNRKSKIFLNKKRGHLLRYLLLIYSSNFIFCTFTSLTMSLRCTIHT